MPTPLSTPTRAGLMSAGQADRISRLSALFDLLTGTFLSRITTKVQTEQVVNLTGAGGTLTIDLSAGTVFLINLTANTTLAFTNLPADATAGTTGWILRFRQTGSFAVTWPTSSPGAVRFPDNIAPTLGTTANWTSTVSLFTGNTNGTLLGYFGGTTPP